MENYFDKYLDDIGAFESTFGAEVSQVEDFLVLHFYNDAGASAFKAMMDEPRKIGTQSVLRGKFSHDFFDLLANANTMEYHLLKPGQDFRPNPNAVVKSIDKRG